MARLDGHTAGHCTCNTPPTLDTLINRQWHLEGELTNPWAGPWDQGRLPLQQLGTVLAITPDRWTLQNLDAQVAGGTLKAQGHAAVVNGHLGPWEAQAHLQGLQPGQVLSTWKLPAIDGRLQAQTTPSSTGGHTRTAFDLALTPRTPTQTGSAPRLQAQGWWADGTWQLDRLAVEGWQARLQASAVISPAQQQAQGEASLQAPGLDMKLQTQGHWLRWQDARNTASATLAMTDLAALQRWTDQRLNDLQALGLQADVISQLPAIWRSTRWQGSTIAQARWENRAWHWEQKGELQWETGGVRWRLPHAWTSRGTWAPDQLQVRLEALTLRLQNSAAPLGWRLDLQQPAQLQYAPDGAATVGAGTVTLTPEPIRTPTPIGLSTAPLRLQWEDIRWADNVLRTKGALQGLPLSWLNAWLATDTQPQGPLQPLGLQGDLLFGGTWDVFLPLVVPAGGTTGRPAPTALAQVSLQHSGGDLQLRVGSDTRSTALPAGIREASVTAQLTGQALSARVRWNSQNAGELTAEASTTLQTPWNWSADAPVRGQVQADLPQVGLWSRLAPPGWRVGGRLQVQAQLAGTRSQPQWNGRLHAQQVSVRSLVDGLDFSDGELLATLSGQHMVIEQLRLRGAGGANGGVLTGQGSAHWEAVNGAGPTRWEPRIDLQLQAQQWRLLARADRRITLSGTLNTRLQGQRLDITGRLDADQALLALPDENTPRLGGDVVIRGQERPPGFGAGAQVQTHANVDLGLGQSFHVQGLGLDTYLSGQLKLVVSPTTAAPQITGQVQTVRGTYQAYGQALGIEQGVVRFNGPIDNPALDILALRPHPTQKVGVQITGTAQTPRVRLYADPDMPDSEKLAWLVLGRSATGAGAEAAVLQRAALALFSGNGRSGGLTRALGLDELSFQSESTATDGSTTAAALTLGKRLTSGLYVSYARSLNGALGTVSVLYDLSRYLTLRAQAGDDSAVDLIFTHSFDGSGHTGTPAAPRP